MFKKFLCVAFFITASFLTGQAIADEKIPFDAEIEAIDDQLNEVEISISRYQSGLFRSLAEARKEALLLLRTVLRVRQEAEAGEIKTEVTIPAVKANPEKAEQLLGEIALQNQRIEITAKEADQAGGLLKAIALGRLETEKLTLAQLQMSYLQERYGIAFPKAANITTTDNLTSENSQARDSEDTSELRNPRAAWADPAYPQIDYSMAPFSQAHKDGDRISGWWVIKEERAAIDDSPSVTAINYAAYDERNFRDLSVLVTYCREGETSFVFLQDDYLFKSLNRDGFDIAYRIDQEPAQNERWSGLTSNKGAGIFGTQAEPFLRKLYKAENFFIRLTEGNGERHDEEFDLSGVQVAIEAVANACSWSTLDLTQADIRTIQTLLNAGGFDAGPADRIWGESSKDALREFQKQSGLRETGAPDRTTLQTLGISAQPTR